LQDIHNADLEAVILKTDMTQFPNQNKLPIFMFKPLPDFNVTERFRAETSASTPVSSRSPVILLWKSSHIRYIYYINNIFIVARVKVIKTLQWDKE